MKHLDLFSGIGGFSLALDNVYGKENTHHIFVEIDEFCQQVLKKHWSDERRKASEDRREGVQSKDGETPPPPDDTQQGNKDAKNPNSKRGDGGSKSEGQVFGGGRTGTKAKRPDSESGDNAPNARRKRQEVSKEQATGNEQQGTSNVVGNKTGLKLQPNFVEWMMGFPQNWTDLNSPSPNIESNASKALATQSSPKSQNKSSKR